MSPTPSVWKTFFWQETYDLKTQSDYQNVDKKFLSYKLEVVVLKTYITLTEVKNNSNQG